MIRILLIITYHLILFGIQIFLCGPSEMQNAWCKDPLRQGSPNPRTQASTGLWPVWNWAAQQEVAGGWVNEASFAAPHRSPSLALPPEPSPPPHPCLWKNCLPWNRSLVPKRLGTAALGYIPQGLISWPLLERKFLNCFLLNVQGCVGGKGTGQPFQSLEYALWDPGILASFLYKALVPNLFSTRDQFRGRQFFRGRRGGVQA